MSNDLQQTRYDRLVRRVGGIIGPGSKVAEVITDLFPMLDVETDRGELLALSDTRIGWGGHRVAAGGANLGTIQLFNPVDSGVLVTCTSVLIANFTFSEFRAVVTGVRLAGVNEPVTQRDTRGVAIGSTTAEVIALTVNLVPIAEQISFMLDAQQLFNITDPNGIVVLAPGTGLTFQNQTGSADFTCSFFWRERTAEQSELSLP